MKYTLINPPKPFLINQKVFPPLGILYLASVLRDKGHEVSVIDMTNLSEPIPYADIYGISSTTPQYPYAVEVAKLIKEAHPEAKLMIGGPHATSMKVDEELFDIVIKGEGERLITKTEKGVHSAEQIRDLDTILFPARDLINLEEYDYLIGGRKATSIMTSRGCVFSCSFCDREMWGGHVRFRSAENVLKELNELNEQYGYTAFMFFDDTFTLNKKRLKKLCAGLKERGYIWRGFSRTDTAGIKELRMMKNAGCYELGLGVESCSQLILDSMNKGTTVEQNTQFIKWCKKVGIRAKAFLIIGFPGETLDSLNKLEKWVKEVKPDDFDLSVFMPVPGSEVWNNPKKYGIELPKDYCTTFYKGTPGQYRGINIKNNSIKLDELLLIRDDMEKRLKDYLGIKWEFKS